MGVGGFELSGTGWVAIFLLWDTEPFVEVEGCRWEIGTKGFSLADFSASAVLFSSEHAGCEDRDGDAAAVGSADRG